MASRSYSLPWKRAFCLSPQLPINSGLWPVVHADYVKGFGGKFGVQTDRQDKCALGWDHQEKLQLHDSQKGTAPPVQSPPVWSLPRPRPVPGGVSEGSWLPRPGPLTCCALSLYLCGGVTLSSLSGVVLKAACPHEAVVAGGTSGRTVLCPLGAAPGTRVDSVPTEREPWPQAEQRAGGGASAVPQSTPPAAGGRGRGGRCGVRPCVTCLSSRAQRRAVSSAARVGPETDLGAWSGFAELFQLLTCFQDWTEVFGF